MKTLITAKQEWANKLGEEITYLFLNNYGYIDYDPELIPEEIEFKGITLGLCINGHEDCPRYNAEVCYWAELEEYDAQIIVEYYRSSILHSITIMPMYEGAKYHFEPYKYTVPKHDIIQTMKKLMIEEL